ncbi:T9SS type A sorting domain-containing protein [bacterium]|nr:T9SS type A sorting domain-containing protein [bacterium]
MTISFKVPYKTKVTLAVYNVLGQIIAVLLDKPMNTGFHEVVWNSNDANMIQVVSGMYLVRMEAEGFMKSQKILQMQ